MLGTVGSRPFLMKPVLLLLWLLVPAALGGGEAPVAEPPFAPDGDFSLFLAVLALMAMGVMLFLIGVGLVVAAVAVGCLALLVTIGIVSSSAMVGLARRRFSAGVRALFYQLAAVLGVPAGMGGLWLGASLFQTPLGFRDLVIVGSLAGLCAGLVLAFTVDRLASLVCGRFLQRVARSGGVFP